MIKYKTIRILATLFFASSTLLSTSVAQAALILWDNGSAVDGTGLSTIRSGGTVFGAGAQGVLSNVVADDFSVGSFDWNVTGFSFFSYQSFADGQFTFTGLDWGVVAGDINTGTTVASGSVAPANGGLQGYRVSSANLSSTDRAIFRLDADISPFVLGNGDYWLRWSILGTANSGPWQPPTADGAIGNAVQSTINNPFAAFTDVNDGLGVEFPFLIHGTTVATAVPEPATLALVGLGLAGLGWLRCRKIRA